VAKADACHENRKFFTTRKHLKTTWAGRTARFLAFHCKRYALAGTGKNSRLLAKQLRAGHEPSLAGKLPSIQRRVFL
jgi:hypothetical protein